MCPHCGGLNSVDEKTCVRCGKNLPGAISGAARGMVSGVSAGGLPMTKLFIGLCVAVFAFCVAMDQRLPFGLTLGDSFRGSTLLRFGTLPSRLASHEPWRLLSAVFVHFGLFHAGMNLLALRSLGRNIEPHFGSARFAILFVVAGVGGFWVSEQWYTWRGTAANTAGASGAIFGLMGSHIGVLLARRDPSWKRVLVNDLIYTAILGFVLPANNAAHLGGFVTGLAIGALFQLEKKPRNHDGLMRAVAALCLLACVASIVLSAQSPIWKEIRQLEQARE
jgi:membrane associated rhomboid family serine protease